MTYCVESWQHLRVKGIALSGGRRRRGDGASLPREMVEAGALHGARVASARSNFTRLHESTEGARASDRSFSPVPSRRMPPFVPYSHRQLINPGRPILPTRCRDRGGLWLVPRWTSRPSAVARLFGWASVWGVRSRFRSLRTVPHRWGLWVVGRWPSIPLTHSGVRPCTGSRLLRGVTGDG